jgi:hypothetical protein
MASIGHHVWNRSSESRVVLLFDIWNPELRDEVDIKDMFAFLKSAEKESGDRRQPNRVKLSEASRTEFNC